MRTILGWIGVNMLGYFTLSYIFSGDDWAVIPLIILIASAIGTLVYHKVAVHLYNMDISTVKRKAVLVVLSVVISIFTGTVIGLIYGFALSLLYIPYIIIFALFVPYKRNANACQ